MLPGSGQPSPTSCPLLTAARNPARAAGYVIVRLSYQLPWPASCMFSIQVDGKLKEAGEKPFDQQVFLQKEVWHGPFLLCAHALQSTGSICRIIKALQICQRVGGAVGIDDCALADLGGSNTLRAPVFKWET